MPQLVPSAESCTSVITCQYISRSPRRHACALGPKKGTHLIRIGGAALGVVQSREPTVVKCCVDKAGAWATRSAAFGCNFRPPTANSEVGTHGKWDKRVCSVYAQVSSCEMRTIMYGLRQRNVLPLESVQQAFAQPGAFQFLSVQPPL